MQLLSLVIRILSGERLERSTPAQNAFWLSFLAIFPAAVFLPAEAVSVLDGQLSDQWFVAAMFVAVIPFFGITLALARSFRRFPFALIPVALATWWGVAAHLWKKIP